jgi:hypothetical protein
VGSLVGWVGAEGKGLVGWLFGGLFGREGGGCRGEGAGWGVGGVVGSFWGGAKRARGATW